MSELMPKLIALPQWQPHEEALNMLASDAVLIQNVAEAQQMEAAAVQGHKYDNLERQFGVNYNPHGLLFCPLIKERGFSPTAMYLRDWMRTLVSQG